MTGGQARFDEGALGADVSGSFGTAAPEDRYHLQVTLR